ncbi:MAG: hypothetical protein LBD99_07010 [Candidatus Margulisbacteria bacterium]|jgi:hypothetical protein|nr:hypothetical protein [Candidatus Margulisiibacteriota bacterium]
MRESRYHICLVQPKQDPRYTLVFREIALLLIHTFAALGRPCSLKVNQVLNDKINIMLGFTIINFQNFPQKLKYIPYQLEQLSNAEGWYKEIPGFKDFLQKAYEIWDYSEANINFLRAENIPAKYLPLGYHEKLEVLSPADKDIDVLFFGSINERRRKILEKLSEQGLKVETLFGVYGAKRDEYLARAKIALNIHYYSMNILESARISYLLNNKVFVITERSADNPYPAVGLTSAPYEQLAGECLKRLADWNNSQKTAELNYQQFKKNYPMTELLAKII